MQWYYQTDGKDTGPVSTEDLRISLQKGDLLSSAQVREAVEGSSWMAIEVALEPPATSSTPDAEPAKRKLSVRHKDTDEETSDTVNTSRDETDFQSVDVGSSRKRGLKRQHLAHVQSFWANTFLVIALLAIVSSQLYHFQVKVPKMLGLGMVEIVQNFVTLQLPLQFGDAYTLATVVAQLLAPVVLILIGILARTNHIVYLLGLIFYFVDTGIHVMNENWLATGVHLVFTAVLLHGYIASLRRLRA